MWWNYGKIFPFESFVYPFIGFSIGVTLGSQIEKGWGGGWGVFNNLPRAYGRMNLWWSNWMTCIFNLFKSSNKFGNPFRNFSIGDLCQPCIVLLATSETKPLYACHPFNSSQMHVIQLIHDKHATQDGPEARQCRWFLLIPFDSP
jgi:hypothetical protein